MKIIGVIHLPPLPGSPGYSGLTINEYVEYALREVGKISSAGFNGVIIENYMDYPYGVKLTNTEALFILDRVLYSVKKEYSNFIVGLNILRNSCVEAIDIVCRNNADFIRVNAYLEPVIAPEGLLEPVARSIWNKLIEYKCRAGIYADVHVKHSKPLLDYVETLYNTCSRGRVSGVVVTGLATGFETPVYKVYIAREICRNKEVWIGSGVSVENIGKYISLADGVVVGTSIKTGSITENPVDYRKAVEIVEKSRRIERIVTKQLKYI